MMRLSLWFRSKRIFKTLLASPITSERSPGYPQTSSKPPWYPLGVPTLTSRTSFMESRRKGSPSRFGILGSPLRLGASRGETSNTLRINVPGSYPLGMGNTSPRSDGPLLSSPSLPLKRFTTLPRYLSQQALSPSSTRSSVRSFGPGRTTPRGLSAR